MVKSKHAGSGIPSPDTGLAPPDATFPKRYKASGIVPAGQKAGRRIRSALKWWLTGSGVLSPETPDPVCPDIGNTGRRIRCPGTIGNTGSGVRCSAKINQAGSRIRRAQSISNTGRRIRFPVFCTVD